MAAINQAARLPTTVSALLEMWYTRSRVIDATKVTLVAPSDIRMIESKNMSPNLYPQYLNTWLVTVAVKAR